MKLRIVSPQKIIDEHVDWIEVNTDVGNFVIQSGHMPMLLVLSPKKEFRYKPTNKREQLLTPIKGFLSVGRKSVTALVHV